MNDTHTVSQSHPQHHDGRHPDLRIKPATLTWTDQGPYSTAYQDRYFHPEDGAGESRYVFLEHNQLPTRFAALQHDTFVIVETGFGTGLNCLETIRLFQQVAPPQARLQFVSCDKHPLRKTDLVHAATQWPHLADAYHTLAQHYPPLIKGVHAIRWPDPRIQVLLWWEDITNMLPTISRVDAWFLDGFAPSRNASMWSELLFQHMARSAHSNTTFATFTAASAVRRGLSTVGFEVTRAPGYGHKRHMLHGLFSNQQTTSSPPITPRTGVPMGAHIVVVGAGIAGVITAYVLAEAGFKVTLIDTHQSPCQEASGNPQAVLYTRLAQADQAHNRFHNTAFHCAINQLQRLASVAPLAGFFPCGTFDVVTPTEHERWRNTLAHCFMDDDWIHATNGDLHPALRDILPQTPLMHFPRAGWFQPATFAAALLNHQRIDTRFAQSVIALSPRNLSNPADLAWTLSIVHQKPNTASTIPIQQSIQQPIQHIDEIMGEITGDVVVLCCPKTLSQLLPTLKPDLKALAGQINQVPATALSITLPSVITGPCTITPCHQGYHTIGSSYRPDSTDESTLRLDTAHNLHQLQHLSEPLASTFAHLSTEALPARAACRWNTRDYLPLIGPVPTAMYTQSCDPGKPSPAPGSPRYHDAFLQDHRNLYLNTAHGSRGFTQSWLAAEIILSNLLNSVAPLDQRSLDAVHPARFIRRRLRKGVQHRPRTQH